MVRGIDPKQIPWLDVLQKKHSPDFVQEVHAEGGQRCVLDYGDLNSLVKL